MKQYPCWLFLLGPLHQKHPKKKRWQNRSYVLCGAVQCARTQGYFVGLPFWVKDSRLLAERVENYWDCFAMLVWTPLSRVLVCFSSQANSQRDLFSEYSQNNHIKIRRWRSFKRTLSFVLLSNPYFLDDLPKNEYRWMSTTDRASIQGKYESVEVKPLYEVCTSIQRCPLYKEA